MILPLSAAVAEYNSCPPAEVVKLRTAFDKVFPITRSEEATENAGLVTLSPIAPDATVDGLALASAEV